MSYPARALRLGGLAASLLLVTVEHALACSVCLAGDPIFDAQGTTAQQVGSFSGFFQVRGWEKKSGLLPGEDPAGYEENDGQRLDLFLGWTPIDRLTLSLDLPWVFNAVTEVEDGERSTSRLSGFGDMSLSASGVIWRNRDVLPSTWLEGRAFLKFPTGRSSQSVNGTKDPHLQVGTGSWDFAFGLAGVHRLEWGSLYSSTSYRINTEGSLDYEYGDVFLANAGLDAPLGHSLRLPLLDPFTAGFELNFRYADFDEYRDQRYRDSGGSILYLAPALRARLPWPWKGGPPQLRCSVQIPATSSWLHGRQHEDPIWFAGLQYTF